MRRAQQPIRWDEGLTGTALKIAQTNASPLRVLAGPGTGKTFSMMRRVARLLQQGVKPGKILVCTFTRTAAADLKKSLAALGTPGARDVNAYTIHSFCFGLLSRAEVMEITGRTPRPLLAFEERFMVEDLKSTQFGGVRECSRRLKAFDAAWARLQSDDPGWPQDATDRAFHQTLISWLRFHQGMLIGELIPETLHYLRSNPAAAVLTAYDHVLVDEYQDLNRADQVVVDTIAANATLTVIGDENQSIYSFRYAHPEGVTTFDQTHPHTHDEHLVDCYRCPRLVVDLANRLIMNNTNRANRTVRAIRDNPEGEVYVVQWPCMQDEARGIAEYIQHRIAAGDVERGQVLVLSPRRQFGYSIRDELKTLGVPAHSFFHEEELEGNPKNLADSEAQQAFALLTLLANPNDRVALRCWCGFGSNSLNKGAWAHLRNHCESTGAEPRAALDSVLAGNLQLPYSRSLVDRYRLLQHRLQFLVGLSGQSLVDGLFPSGAPWAQSLRALCASLGDDDFDAASLLEHLRVNITQPELPTDVDYVRVMSLHKSKGLTADMVVVVGCIEGLIPTLRDDLPPAEQARSLEEQRRLFYVAITRTRRILVLSSVTQIPRKLAHRMRAKVSGGVRTHAATITSRFIAELGPMCPQPIRGRELLRTVTNATRS